MTITIRFFVHKLEEVAFLVTVYPRS